MKKINFGSSLMAGFAGFAAIFIWVSGKLYGTDEGFVWAYGVCGLLLIVAIVHQVIMWNKK